ncbi:MAG TPA: APC family permease [Rubrobacteraceae bacterium]|nr:APC family permease [Rubrobacteraceae bacterium]
MESSGTGAGEAGSPHLKRAVGPLLLLFFIVGDMIGGGIYALVGDVGAITGGAIWTAFLFAMILAVFIACAYAELVTKYPRAGGAASYVHRAFRTPFVSFMVAFAVVLSGLTSASALSLAFGRDYLSEFVTLPVVLIGLVLVIVVALINFRGISESVRVNAVLTIIEVCGLMLIVVIAGAAVLGGTGEPARAFEFQTGSSAPGLILAGAALAFYALVGFEDSVNLAEEARDPVRTYPRVLFGGLVLAGTIYLLVTIAASMAVPTDRLVNSETTPLLEVAQTGPLAVPPKLFALIGLLALSNGILLNMIMASRLIYGMASQGVMPSVLSRVHPGRQTPWVSIVFTTLLAIGLISLGDVTSLASATVVLLLLVFISVNVAVLVLKRDRVEHEHFSTPALVPILGILVCVGLLTQQEGATFLLVGALLVLGVVLYGVDYLVKKSLDHEAPQPERWEVPSP